MGTGEGISGVAQATRGLRRRLGWGALMAIFLLTAVVFGCVEPTSTSTPTPTPISTATPTQTPTPTPTPEPTAAPLVTSADAIAKSGEIGRVGDLVEIVPSEYDSVVYLDVEAMLQDPILREALEGQGGLGIFGPLSGPIQQQLSSMVVAQGDAGLLGVLSGTLKVAKLMNSLQVPGIAIESESYGRFEIQALEVESPFLNLSFALSLVDDTTAVIAIGFSPESPSVDVVKAALDVAEGTVPGYLSDPVARQLVESVPPGFIMVVTKDCGVLFEVGAGCQNLAMSITKAGENALFSGVLGFESPAMAEAALPAVSSAIAEGVDELPTGFVESATLSQEGALVRFASMVSIEEALESGLLALGAP